MHTLHSLHTQDKVFPEVAEVSISVTRSTSIDRTNQTGGRGEPPLNVTDPIRCMQNDFTNQTSIAAALGLAM